VFSGYCQREQDWNVSRKELQELVKAGVITEDEVDEVISIEFNPVSLFCFLNSVALHVLCNHQELTFVGSSDVWEVQVHLTSMNRSIEMDVSLTQFVN
jgi:hypothetical protein